MSKYRIILDGKTYEMEIEQIDGSAIHSSAKAKEEPSDKTTSVHPNTHLQTANENTVKSPMPGTIIRISVQEGEKVKAGQTIMVLEAMKMENDILAPMDGVVKKMHVCQGAAVQGGTLLFEIDG